MALVSAACHPIKSLCGLRQNWRLKVKVVRKWNMSSVASPDDPFALEMLFVDEEGGRIEATVQKHLMHKFTNNIVEGQVYKITRFGILRNGGKFRASGHDFKIIFNSNTQVIACPGIDIPFLGLALTKTSDIKKTKGFSNYLLDFMGIVTAISEETKLNKEGRVTRLMSIELVDEMGEIRCAIFGNMVDTVKGYLTEPRCGLPVMIIQLAKVNVYKGQVGIQNVMNASKIWWNPDIPQAVELKNGLAVHEIESDLAVSLTPQKPRPVSLREEFLEMYPKKSVGELNQLLEQGSFIILGTIAEILDDSLWWYMACTCMKYITYEPGFPFCTGCNLPVYDITPRYKIKVAVTDGEDITHLIMFDSKCCFLLDKACYDLLEEGKVNGCSGYPQEIMDFVGKELLYRVEINEDAMLAYDGCIKVKKLCSDSSIISEYKERVDDETPLKLKYAPLFTKIEDAPGNSCVLELSPQSNSLLTDAEFTPTSCGESSSADEYKKDLGKRPLQEPPECPPINLKRIKVQGIKIEDN